MMLILYFRRKKRAEMHLIVMIAIHIVQCFDCIPFYAIGRREGSLILSTKSQVSSHSFGPSSSSWSLRRQSSRLFWMLSWFRSFPMNTNSCLRSPQGHAWSLGVWDVHILTTIYLPIVLGQCLQNLRLTRRPLPKVSVQKGLKIVERKFLYLNSQSHGLYGLILMILPACWKNVNSLTPCFNQYLNIDGSTVLLFRPVAKPPRRSWKWRPRQNLLAARKSLAKK